MNELCQLYWKPVYAFIRATRGYSNEDAKDMTQAFFEELMDRRFLERASPDLGTFRSYLRGAVPLFLLNPHERGRALTRGGGRRILALDDEPLDAPASPPDLAPEDSFDRQWCLILVTRALEELREELDRSDRTVYYRAFERYSLQPASEDPHTYAQVAAELGLKESDVGNYLTACRKRLREILTNRIRDYVRSDDEVYPEFARVLKLFGGLQGDGPPR